ncbi:hypothetical protein COU37_05065 [Candidatus Micrarchaeota archaeon CG10_big_fil_rev_8_21_14_0_10_45_29]|nr:MAG: hypothetical protein COU37_05065 [Candidatus Micrarchaeota archaeon CG10_big_fil_rev_8_21_14_0_10_45_29]
MRIIDITYEICNNTPVWPGSENPKIHGEEMKVEGHTIHTTKISMTTHTGTHVDFPGHMREDYAGGEDKLSALCGKCIVCPWPKDADELKKHVEKFSKEARKRILFKINEGDAPLEKLYSLPKNPIPADVLKYLLDEGMVLIGMDACSADPPQSKDFPAHKKLFENNCYIIENLNLSGAEFGEYELFCLPLPLKEARDGAPCRAVLVKR